MPSPGFDMMGAGTCSWCGTELGLDGAVSFPNRAGEEFCTRYHREASNAARKRLEES